MAFSGEAEVLTWERVRMALEGAAPAHQNLFRFGLKAWLTQFKQAPQLQFVPFDRTTNGSDGSNAATVICSGAATLIAIYGKKYTGTTLAYLALSNHASAIQAQKELLLQGTAANGEVSAFYPNGLAYATGITYSGVTAYNGTTRSLIVDSWAGLALISA